MKNIDANVRRRIEQNLYPAARRAIPLSEEFPWHCDDAGIIQTHKPHSSQALSIDVFGTLKMADEEVRSAALGAIAKELCLPLEGPWTIELEWRDPANLLGEKAQTQVDAAAF